MNRLLNLPLLVCLASLMTIPLLATAEEPALHVGVAEVDITPPAGFPMAGYYHERLAEGTLDPLKARAIVFRDGDTQAALVVCDLIGIATDLSRAVRQQASAATGIPADQIVLAATHSHTAPDYMKELYLYLGEEDQEQLRHDYIRKLIEQPVQAIVQAHAEAAPARLTCGEATQTTPVAFNRRFVMTDGSVKTWQKYASPGVVKAAGPVDPQVGLLTVRDPETAATKAVFSNFALHLDTVGGTQWSADYPYFIQQTLRESLGDDVISLFGAGCCGDINHSDPGRTKRNPVHVIGNSLGNTILSQLDQLPPILNPRLRVESATIDLPLDDASEVEVAHSIEVLKAARAKQSVNFFDHVTAYRKMIIDQMRHTESYAQTRDHITWGLSRSLAGIGDTLPVDVTVISVGRDLAIVCLPGEVFVELGLAIKQASPFRTTMVVELSNCVETIYIPNRGAYAAGGYEVTNSNLQPGSGEMLVEAAVRLLQATAGSVK